MKPHPMIVRAVDRDSVGMRLGVRPGDRITHVDGETVADPLDFSFRTAEESGAITVRRSDGSTHTLPFARAYGEAFGVAFDGLRPQTCGNKCVFCFVDQNAPDARDTVRIRDEDYRLSFLYGNYITMTNLTRADVARIIEQHLSPLFISVHATDPDARERLLGGQKRARELLPMLQRFLDAGIQVHTQIVMCPTWNDGPILRRSIEDLAALHPGVQTLSVVPVGLTQFREGLPYIPPVTRAVAVATRDLVAPYQERFLSEKGTRFVFLSDEFYVRLGEDPPSAAHYEGYPIIENGVGVMRKFADDWRAGRVRRAAFPREARVAIVTGRLAESWLTRTMLPDLHADGVRAEVVAVRNDYLGDSVTAAGLLAGRDIVPQVAARGAFDVVCLPPNCVNPSHVFIDDTPILDVEARLAAPLYLGLDLRATEIPADWRPGHAAEEGMTPAWSGGAV